ncbi:putative mitochondrial 2-oxoglutarate dehydrogenase E1 component [Leptomonas pyrrhocoris]|uniref:Putative mitochondrial 2-oxoglutarate dehydrogenase E1 component n=1 Tax=Leptomonas pyrrhocoris TaxID=157538 RepID=A0A0N0VFJ7_LEPPY|nr:putative mitochondrial 2-oxoglutarate dehydrogenase E1 component [Leptomonas pyrrhocoris]XP_015659340.1 putative mitochondrial 2-oxoglutarate dehydrogenase E1 component [Leptomonas pyrrhocoris]KPA80900.1 putative mitochondrial 2-oxoglutarate dehydrogenase E1 component [Leptomonas pyrrhocoris]KPA80901.1 putative mitochondrial 2-oxoglutarate dehydrogenase E1 component [Leptomonas pyrrhocoris]|eukprot:XP_015659339.1 putative mitochondrial 2-oxoglutarate dehydrogenase E1 component [Leptomonas pyrrhocoris]
MMRRALSGVAVRASAVRAFTDAHTIRKPNPFDQLVRSENQAYVENLMRQYEADSALVDQSWVPVFEAMRSNNDEMPVVSTFSRPIDAKSLSEKQRHDNMRLSWMIRIYERFGHHIANVDPINGYRADNHVLGSRTLAAEEFGFTEEDLEQAFNVTFGATHEATFVSGGTSMKLGEIVDQLRRLYCGPIGFEFMSSGYFDLRNWFRQEIMNSLQPLPVQERRQHYDDVVKACGFEKFLQVKYSTQQRFGLDGGEAFIPAMNAAILTASELGVNSVIIGMAHRGRLNLLANVIHKSLHAILNEFEGRAAVADAHLSGDVKYHLGLRKSVTLPNNHTVELDLLPNPSHLEAVNSLVLGKAHARQVYTNDVECTTVLPILVHGDASFAGQGSCYETMGFSDLENYHVGGALHVVINNQIGFTTNPKDSRASAYCTDLSKVNNAPVLHVNGDDVDACVKAAKLAARFRQHFHRDIIIDLVCYRRNGHNEADLPDFTQPQLYEQIRHHPRLVDIYTKTLIEDGVITKEEADAKDKEWDAMLRQAYDRMNSVQDFVKVLPSFDPESENTSSDLSNAKILAALVPAPVPAVDTGVDINTLRSVGIHLATVPKGIQKAHPVVERTYAARKKGTEHGDAIEWCQAELMAFATLSMRGIPIRLTGEDVERGTFTQRHAAVTDSKTNLKYYPVKTVSPTQALITISNSSLSELGVCGFEMGYNMENTKCLTMWEAQFGDFANGAQVIFDQFLGCCEEKWNEHSSLILSLPHGYSGAGPEHSSARIERFLQLSDDADCVPADFRKFSNDQALEIRVRRHNWQLTYPSTPANYFHILRRQGLREFSKPLVNFFSKARLRAPNLSALADMAKGSFFKAVLDTAPTPDVVARKVVFCSGQIESIVNDARAAMQKENPGVHGDVVLVTLEQLAPFPWEQVADVMETYAQRNPETEFVWLQEEPRNMGMWTHMRPRMNSLLRKLGMKQARIGVISRPAVASPSTGYGSVHVVEEKKLIEETLA